MERFADRFKEAMKTRGKKQVDIVTATNIPKSVISEYANGKFEPKQDNLYLIAKYLDVKEAWLMGYSGVSMGRHEDDHLTRFGDSAVGSEGLHDISSFISAIAVREHDGFDGLYFRVLSGLDYLNEDGFEKVIDYIQTLSKDERYGVGVHEEDDQINKRFIELIKEEQKK